MRDVAESLALIVLVFDQARECVFGGGTQPGQAKVGHQPLDGSGGDGDPVRGGSGPGPYQMGDV
jgi:hypothetical protein